MQAGRRLIEVPPPLVAKAEGLGREAGKTAAGWVFDGSTPEEEYQRVLRGIEEGDLAVLDTIEPPAIGPGAGYGQEDLAPDLGIEPANRGLPHSRDPGRLDGLNHEARRKAMPGKRGTRPEKNRQYGDVAGDKTREVFL